jgi:hypothetical protein
LSRTTYQRLDSPEAFQIFFDEANSRIGLKPAAKSARDAYLAGPVGSSGGRQVRALRLLNEFALDLPATVRFYDAEIDQDGILVLDLRTARVPPSVLAAQRRTGKPRLPAKRDAPQNEAASRPEP